VIGYRKQETSDTKVTAIYVGWRGARIDEPGLVKSLGKTFGGPLGTLAAIPTLFDRKPISEQVAPGVLSALRSIENELGMRTSNFDCINYTKRENRMNRMIVFGHSLGGNLLITGLNDSVIKAVRRHQPGERLPPVLGDLVVLINPAAEAAKWTAIQRDIWRQIAFNPDSVTPSGEVNAGHAFFPSDQPPVMMSVSASMNFPLGGLRETDCQWIEEKGASSKRLKNFCRVLDDADTVDYDWATHDLFPAGQFDFRPAAQRLRRAAARLAGLPIPGHHCPGCPPAHDRSLSTSAAAAGMTPPPDAVRKGSLWSDVASAVASSTLRFLADILQYFPFQNTNQELTRTIGNLDPVRPADGLLVDKRTSSAPFGTTHELAGLQRMREKRLAYSSLADAQIDCPPANFWLTRALDYAKTDLKTTGGINWDSEYLSPTPNEGAGVRPPAVQFVHGYINGGIAPITRASDPFWNIRAYDNALANHDGYFMTSFICAMNQFVMDDITMAANPGNSLNP